VNFDRLHRVASWTNRPITAEMSQQLEVLTHWLATEATDAGGLGPAEVSRIFERHVLDSLAFAVGWGRDEPGRVLDIGTGVGLPLLPLAITHPRSTFVGLDRSGRRVRLLRRAMRVLDLGNIEPIESDVSSINDHFAYVVSRAAIPPTKLLPALDRLVMPGGRGVVGGSYVNAPNVPGYETVEIPPEVLDRPAWILMMARS